jgi:hypothetical protein
MRSCEITRIVEANAEEMYLRKSEPLRLLYTVAERAYAQLRLFANSVGIVGWDVEE